MLVEVFEVYSESGNRCALFLTEQEAKEQQIIRPADGPSSYTAQVEMTEEELATLEKQRYLWAY